MPELLWHGPFPLYLTLEDDAPAALRTAPAPTPTGVGPAAQPLVELLVAGQGRAFTSLRGCRTAVGARLRPTGHEATHDSLIVRQADPETGLRVETRLDRVGPGVRAITKVTNGSDRVHRLEAVTSLALGGLTGLLGPREQTRLWTGRNECFAENRWTAEPLLGQAGLPDPNPAAHWQPARGEISRTGRSTWSTGLHQPMGVLEGPDGAAAWQVEVSGPWHWELVSLFEATDWAGLLLFGPTDAQHAWSHDLHPGESFETVPVALVVGDDLDDAVGHLTRYRRAAHLDVPADADHPLIYNDYMNTLMGDPTTEKLLPLIDAAAAAGADFFCVDAGWYDDGGNWWPSVGEWTASTTRFAPLGLAGVLQHIRDVGLKPGLWLEPEVVGVRSPLATRLPDEAFMTRGGVRIVDHERYFLDLRHPAAVDHVKQVFARVVDEYGAQYVKWDYNVTPGAGPDRDATSPGDGLLGHVRAHLELVEWLRERYPLLILEACSSGAQRQDGAILARYDLQSTSDQQDLHRYAPIAAAAPMAMPFEQAGNWAYPQPEWCDEDIVFTLVTGLSGRMYLSGKLGHMSAGQLELVRDATAAYRETIAHQAAAVPSWPLGLPGWEDEAVALLSEGEREALLFVWNRGADRIEVPLGAWAGASVETVFPTRRVTPWELEVVDGVLRVDASAAGVSARVVRLRAATMDSATKG